jgi:hypothetical protein
MGPMGSNVWVSSSSSSSAAAAAAAAAAASVSFVSSSKCLQKHELRSSYAQPILMILFLFERTAPKAQVYILGIPMD